MRKFFVTRFTPSPPPLPAIPTRWWAAIPGLHHRIAGWYGGFGLSHPEPSDAHERAQPSAHAHSHGPADGGDPASDHGHAHAHEGDGEDDDGGEPTSTGFLPLSLAISLFVTGLFVLGLIPGVQCG